jgi:hypothetical protein
MSITPPLSPRDAGTSISQISSNSPREQFELPRAAAQSASAALSAYARTSSAAPSRRGAPSAAPVVTSWSASVLTRDDNLEQLAQKAAAAATASKRPQTKIDFALFDPDYDANRRPRNGHIQQLRAQVEARQWPKRQTGANLHALLGIYQAWAAQLRPAVSFDDFLKRTHRLGSTAMIRGLLAAEREGRILHRSDIPQKTKSESTDENKHNDDAEDEEDYELRLFDDEPQPTATAQSMFDALFGTSGGESSVVPRGPSLLNSEPAPPTVISDEQRARAEENRRKALERKSLLAAQKLSQQEQESPPVKRARTSSQDDEDDAEAVAVGSND